MAELRIEKRLIDYVGLNAKGLLESWLAYPKDIGLMLALLQGMGPDGAKLVNVDTNGNLAVSIPATGTSGVDLSGNPVSAMIEVGGLDGGSISGRRFLDVTALETIHDGTLARLQRSASGINVASMVGNGSALVNGTGEWPITSGPAAGSQATATRAAGGAGVRHVLKSILASFSAGVAVAATTIQLVVRDGATGVGTILFQLNFNLPAAIIAPIVIPLASVNIVGSAATAMTVEFTAGLANLSESVNASGYDAN